jgi:transposase-like protein
MRGKAHGDAVKAQVMAALLTGQTVTEVAKAFSINHSLVSRWRKAISVDQLHEVALKKKESIEELLLDYLATNLRTLKAQSEQASRPDYIQKQSASELAVLHGVIADKTFRILGALQPAESEGQS